jgi:hypothetical protein
VTLTLDPTELSTIQQGSFQHNDEQRTVNWQDFNDLAVPLSAYNFQCSSRTVEKYWSRCSTSTKIYDDYSPYFQVPQELVSEAPEWQEWACNNWWGMQPSVVRIEEDMTTSLDGLGELRRHKGSMTAKPTGSPTVGLARVTGSSTTGGVEGDNDALDV